jgi:response regulator of citrate/malate metabolism
MLEIPEKIKALMNPHIIVYSGMCDERSISIAMKQGSNGYICKPATVQQLKEKIGDRLEPLQRK